MHGWESVDTARCSGCGIYTPTSDLRLAKDGRPYCFACPEPAATRPTSVSLDDDWLEVGVRHPALEKRARVTAAVMLIVTLAFPLAACASQL